MLAVAGPYGGYACARRAGRFVPHSLIYKESNGIASLSLYEVKGSN